GLADDHQLQQISRLVGEHKVPTKSTVVKKPGLLTGGTEGGTHVTHGFEWRPRLPVSAIRELRRGWALLIYLDRQVYGLRLPIAQHKWLFRRGLLPWVPPAEGLLDTQPVVESHPALPVATPQPNGRNVTAAEDAGQEAER
ncbi:MAG: hypothetical protein J2P28_09390, partial [Actinobacteria bacterium]|nr:hypothetical protein [Actinomycetota bacterium]